MVYTANWGIIWYRSHLLREPGNSIDFWHRRPEHLGKTYIPWKLNTSPLKIYHPKRKGSSLPTHHFSEENSLSNFRGLSDEKKCCGVTRSRVKTWSFLFCASLCSLYSTSHNKRKHYYPAISNRKARKAGRSWLLALKNIRDIFSSDYESSIHLVSHRVHKTGLFYPHLVDFLWKN